MTISPSIPQKVAQRKPSPGSQQQEATEALRRDLRTHLLRLNFHAFARCIALLLERMGYTEVHLAGRTDFKGRNRHGGYDIEAKAPNRFAAAPSRRVIVTLKQFDSQMVFQKSIDELRGTCLRVGANEALLITSGGFAPSVEAWYQQRPEPILAPVRPIDGPMLLNLLIAHGVGIQETPNAAATKPHRYRIDKTFFANLASDYAGNGPTDRTATKRNAPLKVTVQVERLGDRHRHSGQLILGG